VSAFFLPLDTIRKTERLEYFQVENDNNKRERGRRRKERRRREIARVQIEQQ